MSNVIAINAAAKKTIAAARATSDEMLLQSIATGDRIMVGDGKDGDAGR